MIPAGILMISEWLSFVRKTTEQEKQQEREEENNEGTEFEQQSRFYRHRWRKQNL